MNIFDCNHKTKKPTLVRIIMSVGLLLFLADQQQELKSNPE